MGNNRISTGIQGLDEILHGGFMPDSSYLIVGGPGSGKTILSLQFMLESIKRKARCLYITYAEPEETIRKNAASFGWDLTALAFADLTKHTGHLDTDGEYTVFPPSEVEKEPVWKAIYQAVEEHKPDRLVIDSVTFLRYLSTDEHQYRKQTQKLVNHLSSAKCLSLLLFEPSELEKEISLALAVDGVIALRNEISAGKVTEIRSLEVSKLRGSPFLSGRHPLRITAQGIVVWPHKVEGLKKYDFERIVLESGISELDEMIGGGFMSGTCTLISGPSGVGKSTISMQFLSTAASKGIKGALYTFEEGTPSILSRARALRIPLEDRLEDGSITIREVNALEFYPDEFLQIVREDVQRNNIKLVVLDSLRGYCLAMEEHGNLTANMHNLVNYLRRNRVGILLVNEIEKLTGDLRITDLGVSYLADNVLLIRYAEYNGEVIKVISCLKKRLGDFQPELREFRITTQGIQVGEKLRHLRGVLTGVPIADTAARKLDPARENDK